MRVSISTQQLLIVALTLATTMLAGCGPKRQTAGLPVSVHYESMCFKPYVGEYGKCPAPSTELPLAQVMSKGQMKQYHGCDIVTEAEFLGAEGGGRIAGYMNVEGVALFQVVPPGAEPTSVPGTGLVEGYVIAVPTDQAGPFYSMARGTRLRLRGFPDMCYMSGTPFDAMFYVKAFQTL